MPETSQARTTPATDTVEPRLASPLLIQRLGMMGALLGVLAALLALAAWWAHQQGITLQAKRLAQIALVESRLQDELTQLNRNQIESLPAWALKGLLEFGQSVSRGQEESRWFGAIHAQTLQQLTTQAIEALGKPVGGVDLSPDDRRRLESDTRLNGLERVRSIRLHLAQVSNGWAILLTGLSALLGILAIALLLKWWNLSATQALNRRIVILGQALNTQSQQELRLEGAHSALEGLTQALKKARDPADRQDLIRLGQQLQELHQSGQSVLSFAKSFHQLSAQGTQVAKTALNSEQRHVQADSHMQLMQQQLEGLRQDIRLAAQGLRKAGEVSRQLLTQIDSTQIELGLTEADRTTHLQGLVEQSQMALKEAIEGLVLASQKINMGQIESQKLAEFLAVNHTAWANLLDQIEQYTEHASRDSEAALVLARRLIRQGHNQAANAPPQLLP